MEIEAVRPNVRSASFSERHRTVVAIVVASTISLLIWTLVVALNVQ
jgi:hypothetical protein